MKVSDQPKCAECPLLALWPTADYVPPKLVTGDRLAIGMNPGKHEVAHHPPEPFVGPSGQLLNYGYQKIGVKRSEVSVVNTHQCRLPLPTNLFLLEDKARQHVPHATAKIAVLHCWRTHVIPILQDRQWQRIDLLGAAPMEWGTGKKGLDVWGGYQLPMLDAPQLGEVAVATYHPAFLMRDAAVLPLFYNDLRRPLTPAPEQHILQAALVDFPTQIRSLDLETTAAGYPVENIDIRLLSLSNTAYQGRCFAWNAAVAERLQTVLNGTTELYGHNIVAFDMTVLEAHGIRFNWCHADPAQPEMQVWDTMLMHHLLWPTLTGMHNLGVLGRQYTTQKPWKQWRSSEDPEELYACRDAANTLAIGEKLRAELVRDAKLLYLYKFTQIPLARMCHHMSQNGLLRDPAHLRVVRERTQAKMERMEETLPPEIRSRMVPGSRRTPAPAGSLTKAGKPRKFILEPYEERESPWNSAQQLGAWLYETKQFAEQHNEAGNRTTNKEALDKLWHKHRDPALKAVRELKSLKNLLSNTCKEMPQGQERLHPSFLPHGTNTGRLSSSGPNIQNWNEKDADGDPTARYIVVPSEPGWEIGAADYSQIEPRLTAWFSNDAERLSRFDIPKFNEHKYVAALFFDIPYELDTQHKALLRDEVVKDNDKDAPYGVAKRINNGANYCLGPASIAKKNAWGLVETKQRYEKWRRMMPRCVEWQQATMAEAKARRMLYTPFGRRGMFYMPNSGPAAVAFRPQSTAADIIYRAMLALLYERIGWPLWKVQKVVRVIRPLPQPVRIIAQVHDQLLFEYPREMRDDVMGIVREVMAQPWPELESDLSPNGLVLPVTCEWSASSWGELGPYAPEATFAPAAAS